MPTDFRASQIQTNKIIASGSTGTSTNALLLIYPISKQSGSNQGFINTSAFGLGGIGTDVFMFVSGAIGSRGTGGSNATTVFGGDVHISGILTFPSSSAPQYWNSTVANTIFTTGSVEITGTLTLGTGSSSTSGIGNTIALKTIPVGDSGVIYDSRGILTIKASNVTVSGSGGHLILSGGNGGYVGTDAYGRGGGVFVKGGDAGRGQNVSDATEFGFGGEINVLGGTGMHTEDAFSGAGSGGSILINGGVGGSASLAAAAGGTAGQGGTGGPVSIYGGTAGYGSGSASGGNGGYVFISASAGGNTRNGTGGTGGGLVLAAGDGGNVDTGGSGSWGIPGDINIFCGDPGISGALAGLAGNITIAGGNAGLSFAASGSIFQIGDTTGGTTNKLFRRIFLNTNANQLMGGYFPGTDIFFFVSGILNGNSTAQMKTVLPDVIMSGNIWFKSSSTNPTPIIYNGPRNGGILFVSNSVEFVAAKAPNLLAQFLFLPGAGEPASIPGGDAVFFVSGTVGGLFKNVSASIAVLPDTWVSGTLKAALGLSGSLQKLTNGLDYAIGGVGITVNTNSLGQVEISGSNTITVVSKSANFTLAVTDQFVHVFTTGSTAVTMSLPSTPGARQFIISKITGSLAVVIPSGSGYTVNGTSTDFVLPGSTSDPTAQLPQSWLVYCDSVNWFVR